MARSRITTTDLSRLVEALQSACVKCLPPNSAARLPPSGLSSPPRSYERAQSTPVFVVKGESASLAGKQRAKSRSSTQAQSRPQGRIRCPHCDRSGFQVKAGRHKSGSQRYLCKRCQHRYTPVVSRRYSNEMRLQAVRWYLNGAGYRKIGRRLGVDHVTVMNWVRRHLDPHRYRQQQVARPPRQIDPAQRLLVKYVEREMPPSRLSPPAPHLAAPPIMRELAQWSGQGERLDRHRSSYPRSSPPRQSS